MHLRSLTEEQATFEIDLRNKPSPLIQAVVTAMIFQKRQRTNPAKQELNIKCVNQMKEATNINLMLEKFDPLTNAGKSKYLNHMEIVNLG